MRHEEFSNGFDTLLSSYANAAQFGNSTSKADIALDEYEKSVFLTEAQEDVVLGLYNGRNPLGESFEQTEELRRYLSTLIREVKLDPVDGEGGTFDFHYDETFDHSSLKILGIDRKSKFFCLPSNLWFITYEAVEVSDSKCEDTASLEVIPVRQDEYHKIRKNPFRGVSDRRALRLDLSDNVVEIISKFGITSYYVRYLKKLKPIVLVNLTEDNLAVNGVSVPTECELPESLHQMILERAVAAALQSRGYNTRNENN